MRAPKVHQNRFTFPPVQVSRSFQGPRNKTPDSVRGPGGREGKDNRCVSVTLSLATFIVSQSHIGTLGEGRGISICNKGHVLPKMVEKCCPDVSWRCCCRCFPRPGPQRQHCVEARTTQSPGCSWMGCAHAPVVSIHFRVTAQGSFGRRPRRLPRGFSARGHFVPKRHAEMSGDTLGSHKGVVGVLLASGRGQGRS